MNENEKDFLKFYMEQTWQEMRHIENLKERVTILFVTITSVIVGFIIQQEFAIVTKPFLWFAIILGLFGIFMTLGLIQMHHMEQRRLNEWYKYYLNSCGADPEILKLRDAADNEKKHGLFYIATLGHNYFWSGIHIFIVGACIVFLFFY